MVINAKDFSPIWSDLRSIVNSNDQIKPLVRWAVSQFCRATFRTHSKIDKKGKHKKHDFTSCIGLMQKYPPIFFLFYDSSFY